MAGMRHLMHHRRVQVHKGSVPGLRSDGEVRQERLQQGGISSQISLYQFVAPDERPVMEHRRTAARQVLEDPDAQVLRRRPEVQVRRDAAGDIVIGGIVHDRPAPEGPVGSCVDMDIHARGRPGPQGRHGRGDKDEVQTDGKARAVLEDQPVPRCG